MSEEDLAEFLELPEARSEEEEIAGLEEDAAILAETMGAPVQVDITRFPFRAIAYLDIHLGAVRRRGSAFFVTPHVLATAGHNLRTSFGTVTQVDVIVAMHGGTRPGTRYTAQLLRPHPAFTPDSRDRDVGIVRLAADVGRATGFFALADFGVVHAIVHVSGYPGGSSFQAASAGSIRTTTPARLQYDARTLPGHSGGAAFIPRMNPREIVAVGVHTQGPFGSDPFSYGVRMSSDVKSWILGFA